MAQVTRASRLVARAERCRLAGRDNHYVVTPPTEPSQVAAVRVTRPGSESRGLAGGPKSQYRDKFQARVSQSHQAGTGRGMGMLGISESGSHWYWRDQVRRLSSEYQGRPHPPRVTLALGTLIKTAQALVPGGAFRLSLVVAVLLRRLSDPLTASGGPLSAAGDSRVWRFQIVPSGAPGPAGRPGSRHGPFSSWRSRRAGT